MTKFNVLVVTAIFATCTSSSLAFSPNALIEAKNHASPASTQLHSIIINDTSENDPQQQQQGNEIFQKLKQLKEAGGVVGKAAGRLLYTFTDNSALPEKMIVKAKSSLLGLKEYLMEERSPVEIAKTLAMFVIDRSSIHKMISPDIYNIAPNVIKLVDQKVQEMAEPYKYNPEGKQVPIFTTEYAFPSLYGEVDDMLRASMFMYVWAEIRSLAKEANSHQVPAELIEAALKLSLNVGTAEKLLLEHSDVISKAISEKKHEQVRRAFSAWGERGADHDQGKLLKFNDIDNGAVYAIGVLPSKKRVTLAFRGTNTQNDALKDIKVTMRSVSNPLRDYNNQSNDIRYHAGFDDYLRPKLQEIKEDLEEVMKEYEGYKLYVTGHSLGAALATMCSFEIAASDCMNLPHPVSCISLASPYVGDYRFRDAFQLLEASGKLRHLRVHNKGDLVTVLPFVQLPYDPERPSFYKHVGIGLELKEEGSRLHYTTPTNTTAQSSSEGSFESRLFDAWKGAGSSFAEFWGGGLLGNIPSSFENTLQNHLGQYRIRLTSNEAELGPLSLNDLYADPALVGSLEKLADGE